MLEKSTPRAFCLMVKLGVYPRGFVNDWLPEDTMPMREVSYYGVTGVAGIMEPIPVSEVINSYPF